ncbi:soil-associated protein, TIGR03435 family [Terriglobus roseus]|uniref:Soil-associated protein, TIGR03435 family n=2 Tax=Terriglobus roseus TaxID=392734 RepID=A0A1H4NJE8_9BACT|nr:soil-associated protein, TIGR03435 family [Terriglobus roseus]
MEAWRERFRPLKARLSRFIVGGTAILFLGLMSGASGARAQAASTAVPKQEFDVASVRLNKDGVTPQSPVFTNMDLDPGDLFVPTHGVFALRNKSLRTLIAFAYKMSGDQQNFLKQNVPDFVLSERFDIQARSLNKDATKDDYRAMMRSLLEERFRLKVHNETREAKVYDLLLASPGKLGRTLRLHPVDDKTCDGSDSKQQSSKLMPDGYPAICGAISELPWGGKPTETRYSMGLGGRNVPVSLLAAALTAPYTGDTGLDHAVIDTTGIAGNVDFTLRLGYDEIESTNTPDTAPLFAQELRDQLGMKLKADKGTINVYVVDHVEHLIEN